MREQVQKPENTSHTIQRNSKASKQAPINEILQAYKDRMDGKPVQRQSVDEVELLQAKAAQQDYIRSVLQQYKERNIQRYTPDEDEELIQGKFESDTSEQKPVQREEQPNNTGLPDNLKTGIENLSGYSMDDVKVHYNSNKPAQLNALAYAQGTDIHIAPGQKQHLPHEAWHVVQQMQGRVQPTMQMQGVNVNDNEGLEKEADVMGGKALDNFSSNYKRDNNTINTNIIIQRVLEEVDKNKANDFFDLKIREIGNPYTPRNTRIIKWIMRVSSNLDEAKMMINYYLYFFKRRLDEALSDSEDTKPQKEFTEELFERLLELKLSFSSKPVGDDFIPDYAILKTERTPMKSLFSEMKETRSLILGLINIAPDLFATLFAENSIEEDKEDMPYYHHSQMVINQFNEYFASKDKSFIDDNLMRVMLMFHDINKQRSLKKHGKIGEHMDTVDAIQEICKDVLSKENIKIISVMTSADPFGSFFKEIDQIREFYKKNDTTEKNELIVQARQRCCEEILVLAKKAEIPAENKEEFFDRYVQFYQSDFSAYSGHAPFTDECYKKPKTGEDSTRLYPPSFNTCFFKLEEQSDHKLKLDAESGFLSFSKDGWDDELVKLKKLFLNPNSERDYSLIITKEAQNEKMRKEFESKRYSQKESEYIDFGELIFSIYKKKNTNTKLYDEICKISTSKHELQSKCKCLLDLHIEVENNDPTMDEFKKKGLFIRKIWPEYDSTGAKSQETVRVKLQKEVDTIYERILKEPITPFVIPSTLVKSGIPINLTDAQGGLLHASGIIYSGDTKLAPASKEHNESAQLSSVLNESVTKRIHSHEVWRSIVRHVIDKTGGKSYDTREELVDKMQEMEDRRSGLSPDLSTKELMLKKLEHLDDNTSLKTDGWILIINDIQSITVKKQLLYRFSLYLDGEESILCKVLKDKCKTGIRDDRTHSIYGGGKREIEKGNRYLKSEKSDYDPLKASSEALGYDGYTFQTNEALLLPDSLDLWKGVYVNKKSIASLFHALNLAREFFLLTDRKAPLLTYESYLGEEEKGIMKNITIKDIINEIETELDKDKSISSIASLLIKKSEGSTETTLTPKGSTETLPTPKKKIEEMLLALFQNKIKFLPDQTLPKRR